MENKALLVIDIQEDYTGVNASKKTRYKNAVLFKNEGKREAVFKKIKEIGVNIIDEI